MERTSEETPRMRLKTLNGRARSLARRRRHRTPRDAKLRPGQPEGQARVWSLLLPVGYPPDRR